MFWVFYCFTIMIISFIGSSVFAITVSGVLAESNWCWAASIQCVSSFYGTTYNQCDVVNIVC